MRRPPILNLALAIMLGGASVALGGPKYTGRYLYTQPRATDSGGLRVRLAEASPSAVLAAAFGRRKHNLFRAKLEKQGKELVFEHLPTDVYDLIVVADGVFFEGIRLVRQPDADALAVDRTAIDEEIRKIEGFFDRKLVHRLEIEGEAAATVLQQWREKKAVQQSGAVVQGSIHSVDLIWFAKPKKGWQLLKRRQLYRDELALRGPLAHYHKPPLGNIRVIGSVKELGPLELTRHESPINGKTDLQQR